MKSKFAMQGRNRRAFTLVELIVVLMILVGLAAVLIPAVTDMVGRTSRSSAASNIAEISGAIQRYEAQYMTYPDHFDSLVSNLATGAVLGTVSADFTAAQTGVTLAQGTFDALAAAGLTQVGVHVATDATFELPTATALANNSQLTGPSAATQVALGLEQTGTNGKYIFLGVGSSCDMNGKTMIGAPVHFPRDAASNPESTYSRYLAIFQITDGTDPLARAKFVGVVAPDGFGLDEQLGSYFHIASNR
jgi:prepilin-type N-terminal cleavage/methylation domain-containing protein